MHFILKLQKSLYVPAFNFAQYSITSCSTTWRSYGDHRLLWRHFTPSIMDTRTSFPTVMTCDIDIDTLVYLHPNEVKINGQGHRSSLQDDRYWYWCSRLTEKWK